MENLAYLPGIGKIWKTARGQKREAVMLWGGEGTSYDRVDPKFWLAAPIRHFIFGCEPRIAAWSILPLGSG
jgi:hypothetical protein